MKLRYAIYKIKEWNLNEKKRENLKANLKNEPKLGTENAYIIQKYE